MKTTLRRHSTSLALLIALLSAAACSTSAKVREQEDATRRFGNGQSYLTSHHWWSAFKEVDIYLNDPQSPHHTKAVEMLRRNPGFLPGIEAELRAEVNSAKAVTDVREMVRRLTAVAQSPFAKDIPTQAIRDNLRNVVLQGNRSGRLPYLLKDSGEVFFEELAADPEGSMAIFQRSLKQAVDDKTAASALHLLKYVEARGPASPEYSVVGTQLRALSFTTTDLRGIVSALYPAEAAELLRERIVRVYLTTQPPRRLVEEDLKQILQRKSDRITFVRTQEADAISVVVRQVDYEERPPQDNVRTVIVPSHQHDLLVGALLIPRNATTQFELAEGAAQIQYGYEVIAEKSGRIVSEALLRDTVSQQYHFCSNMRVVNVFGGVQAASAFPNDQVRSVCQSGQQRPSIVSLRSVVLDRVADAIQRLDVLKDAFSP